MTTLKKPTAQAVIAPDFERDFRFTARRANRVAITNANIVADGLKGFILAGGSEIERHCAFLRETVIQTLINVSPCVRHLLRESAVGSLYSCARPAKLLVDNVRLPGI